MKKLASIFLALVMILGLRINAFAANETYTLTITGAAGHTYDIYQIYTGKVSLEGTEAVLSNVKYGANHVPEGGKVGDDVPADELKVLTTPQVAVDILKTALSGTPFGNDLTPADGATFIEIDLPAGYYMIIDVTNEDNLPEEETKSPIMLQVVEKVSIASKHASISSEKKVDDKNDSNTNEDTVKWQDSADYDINDAVPFQLSVTIPSTYHTYDDYTLTFHDQQAAGFSAPTITSVYILKPTGAKITINEATATTSGYSLLTCTSNKCELGRPCSFTVQVGNVKDFYTNVTGNADTSFAEGDKIIVEYTSVLNNTANVGKAGNENSMYVCHPDGHTPLDKVTVFTYELKVNKIDGATKAALKGAGFTLYKWNVTANDWVAIGDELKGDDMTTFTWSGIDDGKYKLVETTTPPHYNTMTPKEFEVTAQHKPTWVADGNSAFMDLIATDATGKVAFADSATVDGVAVEDGKLEGDVENHKGAVLPETGAQGTMMLIGGGAMLVIVAAVFMITRKKMSVYEF